MAKKEEIKEEENEKKEYTTLTKKELKNERRIVTLPLSKKFIQNMMTFIETEEDWDLLDNWRIKGKKVTMTFELSDSAIDKQMILYEKKQKKLLQLREKEKKNLIKRKKKQDGTLDHIPLEQKEDLLEKDDIVLEEEEEFL